MISNVINVKLREMLDQRDMSLYRLAKDTGISYNNLRRISTKKAKVISFDVLEKICVALGCEPGDLLALEK